ncbi:uncharacterized protein B0I36DRAFT_393727, partial [Microdochium trichocladiopsis]
ASSFRDCKPSGSSFTPDHPQPSQCPSTSPFLCVNPQVSSPAQQLGKVRQHRAAQEAAPITMCPDNTSTSDRHQELRRHPDIAVDADPVSNKNNKSHAQEQNNRITNITQAMRIYLATTCQSEEEKRFRLSRFVQDPSGFSHAAPCAHIAGGGGDGLEHDAQNAEDGSLETLSLVGVLTVDERYEVAQVVMSTS